MRGGEQEGAGREAESPPPASSVPPGGGLPIHSVVQVFVEARKTQTFRNGPFSLKLSSREAWKHCPLLSRTPSPALCLYPHSSPRPLTPGPLHIVSPLPETHSCLSTPPNIDSASRSHSSTVSCREPPDAPGGGVLCVGGGRSRAEWLQGPRCDCRATVASLASGTAPGTQYVLRKRHLNKRVTVWVHPLRGQVSGRTMQGRARPAGGGPVGGSLASCQETSAPQNPQEKIKAGSSLGRPGAPCRAAA